MKYTSGKIDAIKYLMPLNIGHLYIRAEQESKYGYLLLMATSSKGQLGALMAESFCERCISAANMISTDSNVRLGDEEIDMLVVLKMNKKIMDFMRTNYGKEIKKEFGQKFNESRIG